MTDTIMTGSLADEIAPVIAGGFCVGCGGCAVRAPEAIRMERNPNGFMQPIIIDPIGLQSAVGGVCAFADDTPDEDQVAEQLFADAQNSDAHLGRFRQTLAGHVAESDFREKGSSGGVTSWVLTVAMRRGLIDKVVHVHAADGRDLFRFEVSSSEDEIRLGAKTRYYSVSLDEALRRAVSSGYRIAFVGVPCFVKTVRHLAASDPSIDRAVKLTVAVFCGHMKSSGFGESLAWQVGVAPSDIAAIDFRVKRAGEPATKYGFSATSVRTGRTEMAPMSTLAGRSWDGGYFRLKSCDFCDDVVGETADIALGDAWLPEFDGDPNGTNIVIVRSSMAEALIDDGIREGHLALQEISADRAVASQGGGFRDRRIALAYRLHLADLRQAWRPRKRIRAQSDHVSSVRKLMYRVRGIVRHRSFASLKLSKSVGSVKPYQLEMTGWHAALRLISLLESRLAKSALR